MNGTGALSEDPLRGGLEFWVICFLWSATVDIHLCHHISEAMLNVGYSLI